jgi:putative transposase
MQQTRLEPNGERWRAKEREDVPFWLLLYHLVWTTKGREPWIQPHYYVPIEGTIKTKAQELKSIAHAVGIMPDHVHVVVSIPPAKSVATVVARMKGSTSHLINDLAPTDSLIKFAWQGEYGAFSFGPKGLAVVKDYVNNQPARHASGKLWPTLERTSENGDFS